MQVVGPSRSWAVAVFGSHLIRSRVSIQIPVPPFRYRSFSPHSVALSFIPFPSLPSQIIFYCLLNSSSPSADSVPFLSRCCLSLSLTRSVPLLSCRSSVPRLFSFTSRHGSVPVPSRSDPIRFPRSAHPVSNLCLRLLLRLCPVPSCPVPFRPIRSRPHLVSSRPHAVLSRPVPVPSRLVPSHPIPSRSLRSRVASGDPGQR